IDHRVDLWSLGVRAWECRCGFRPVEDRALGARPDLAAEQWGQRNVECDPPRRRAIREDAADAPLRERTRQTTRATPSLRRHRAARSASVSARAISMETASRT